MSKLAPAKRLKIIEPTRARWLAQTKAHAYHFNMKTLGSDVLDIAAKLHNAPRDEPWLPESVADAEPCERCDAPITHVFVEGFNGSARCWAHLCPRCHREVGIGLGKGRGYSYVLVCSLETHEQYFMKVMKHD